MPIFTRAWRAAFDAVERPTSRFAEQLVETDVFASALAAAVNVNAAVWRQCERSSSRWLRAYGIPSAGAVQELSRQIGDLRAELADAAAATQRSGPSHVVPLRAER